MGTAKRAENMDNPNIAPDRSVNERTNNTARTTSTVQNAPILEKYPKSGAGYTPPKRVKLPLWAPAKKMYINAEGCIVLIPQRLTIDPAKLPERGNYTADPYLGGGPRPASTM